jgi:LmbE family N-acetylglucosaminyl deacetylase
MLKPDDITRVLAVMAHPDDVDFVAAGSIALWQRAGVEVSYCIITDGDAGGFDPAVPRSEIGGIRQREQTAAAAALGVTELAFLGYPDGRLEVSLDLRRDIAREIRRVRPQILICQSPTRVLENMYGSHPDHLAAGEATLCAVYPDARNPFAHPELLTEGFAEWAVPEVWVADGSAESHFVDVTEVYDLKVAALLSHASQMQQPEEELHTLLRGWMGRQATTAGLPEGRMAEAFRVLDTAG